MPTAERPTSGSGGAGRWLRFRAAATLGAIVVAFLLLAGRLAHLQITEADEYLRLAERQQRLRRDLPARRGSIYDRKGALLASTGRVWSVYADPKAVKHPELTAQVLADSLDVAADTLACDLQKDRSFVWVKRRITNTQEERIRKLGLPGVYLRRETRRRYPQGSLAAHVIGFTDVDGRGLAGIEHQLDALLRGRPGEQAVFCDGARRVILSSPRAPERAPFDGYDVYLTIDATIQDIAEDELARAVEKHKPECGMAVVMDVRDGSVLALASWPTFDPQAPAAAPVSQQRNIAITDAFEFGSAFKPIVAALAVERDLVKPDTQFDCHKGEWRIGRRLLHDSHPYGVMSLRDVLCHSSNIGMAQVAMRVGAEGLYEGIRGFGFGAQTGIALPGETGGIVRPLRVWNDYSVVSVSFGQELATTALSLTRAFAAFANGGCLLQPRVVKEIRHSHTGEVAYKADGGWAVDRPIGTATAQEMLRMLRRVVTDGSGKRADRPGYPMAGKTGTAQLLRPDGRGYSDSRYLSTFVAVGPVPDCRIAVLVSLKATTRNGYYGSVAAAPAVGTIAERTLQYMQVPPAAPLLALDASGADR
jgi:cell division protein FtsI (penicillin-binding protein 3)